MTALTFSPTEARRLAVKAQLLAAPRPKSVLSVVERLGGLQMDPINAVARAERLVLWSRLGAHDPGELDRELWDRRRLFEYSAYIVPAADFPIHRETMRRFTSRPSARGRYLRDWMNANGAFRRYVLARLGTDGPLRSRDIEDRAAVPWRTGGWNDGKNVGRMLEILWFAGEIATAGRDGQERLWDLAERRLPVKEPRLDPGEVARRLLERQLRARGVAKIGQFGFAFDGRPPVWKETLQKLVADGVAVPARIEGLRGDWFLHRDALEGRFRGRTTLLSPFDPLISDRARTEQLFGFRFAAEIYVPKEQRKHGYYVMPILHGDRLIGRVDPLYDRGERRLRVNAVQAEPGADAAGEAVAGVVRDLARWVGADDIAVSRRIPRAWSGALRALSDS